MTVARSPAQVIAGEAVSGSLQDRWNDMLNIASTMYNRSMMTGVPISDISSVTSQYNAYGHPLPAGTVSYVGLAQQALDYVAANGPVNNSTFYATPAAVNNLPPGLQEDATTKGHVYFSDPQFRSILTTQGYVTPDPSQLGVTMAGAPVPEARPAMSTPDLSKTGLLGALFSSEPTAPSLTNGFSPLAAAPPISAPMNVSATGLLGTPNLDASAQVGSPLSNSGWQTMANAGPPGGIPADPNSVDRMGNPALNSFQAVSFAPPVQAPMDVTASAAQPTNAALAAQASVPAGLLSGSPATASMFAGPSLTGNLGTVSQQGLLNGTVNAVNASQQQALSTPMLSQAMSPSYPSLSQPIDVGQLSANSPFATPAVDPSVNAALSSFSAPTAVTGTTNVGSGTGIPSTVSQRMGMPVSDWSTMAAATPISAPTLSSSTVSATPTTTGLLSGYQATPSTPPAQSAINGLLSGPATTAGNMSMLNQAMNPVSSLQTGIPQEPGVTGLNLGVQDPTYQNIVNASFPASIPSIEAASNLPSVTPSAVDANSSTVPGPATTSATQQQTQAKQPTAPKSALSGIFNGPTMVGGLLGALAGGPVGGLLGGLVGNRINANGGLSGMLGSHPMSINNIGGGLANVAGVYGGAPLGTQANTNNGGTVTSLGGGWTAYTNPYGVTSVEGPNMEHAADWSGMFGGTSHGPVGNGQPGGGGAVGGSGLF